MSLGDKLRKALGNAVAKSDRGAEARSTLSTGIPAVDYALGGGIIEGALVEIFGESTVGKSLLQDEVLILNQQRGGCSVKYNTEEAHNPAFFAARGGDPEALIVYPNPDDVEPISVEAVFMSMEKVMLVKRAEASTEPLVLGWDSIASTLPEAVLKEDPDEANMKSHLARAVAMSNCTPRILTLAKRTGTTIIATNQIRESPNPFERNTRTPGGLAWGFYCSQRLELRKGATIKAETGEKIGHWIEGEIVKNRLDSSLRTFRIPCYTRTEFPHPSYEVPLESGIHKAEALWEFYFGSKKGSGETGRHVLYFMLPDGKPVVEASTKKGFFELHSSFGAKSFRKTDWLAVLSQYPQLADYRVLTAMHTAKEAIAVATQRLAEKE